MSTYIVNDNGVNREMTADEAATYEAWATDHQATIDTQQKAEKKRLKLRASAFAKLGLTDDEIAALG